MHLTSCELTNLLGMAKAAHSKLDPEILNSPDHSWERWYADWIMARLKEVDYEGRTAFKREPLDPDGRPDFGLAPSCPPGPKQEVEDALLYRDGWPVIEPTPARDEQDSKLSPPSPASGWR